MGGLHVVVVVANSVANNSCVCQERFRAVSHTHLCDWVSGWVLAGWLATKSPVPGSSVFQPSPGGFRKIHAWCWASRVVSCVHCAAMPCLPMYRQQWLRATFFDDSTTTGRAFGIAVLVCILVSVCAVCAESVRSIDAAIGGFLFGLEVVLALLFTAELALRCAAAETVMHYVLSGFGVIDLVAVVPFYVELAMGADGAKVCAVFLCPGRCLCARLDVCVRGCVAVWLCGCGCGCCGCCGCVWLCAAVCGCTVAW